MEEEQAPDQPANDEIHRRRITLADGRYMIFYTFPSSGAPPAEPPAEEPRPAPEAEEERRV